MVYGHMGRSNEESRTGQKERQRAGQGVKGTERNGTVRYGISMLISFVVFA